MGMIPKKEQGLKVAQQKHKQNKPSSNHCICETCGKGLQEDVEFDMGLCLECQCKEVLNKERT